ncbi:MAG: hypothetical protein J6X75_00410 [Clostridia bacterium]|nr:hypothetical protein [Clostridia bacterium]
MNMEEVMINEGGIRLGQVLRLLFGHIKMFVIVGLITLLTTFGALMAYVSLSGDYESRFTYKVAGLTSDTYIDGSRFDVRDLLTSSKLSKYISSNEALSSLNASDIYYAGGVKSFEKIVPVLEEGEAAPNQIENEFSIVLDHSMFTKEQAAALAEAIASEPIEITLELISRARYDMYLRLFDEDTNYADKVSHLISQLTLLEKKYNELISSFGDVYLDSGYYGGEGEEYYLDGFKVSDAQLQMSSFFKSNSLYSLESELALCGYIDESGIDEYRIVVENKKERLSRELLVLQAKLDSIIALRDSLVDKAVGTSLQTTELAAYNEEIVRLAGEIEDVKEELFLTDIMIANLEEITHDETYLDSAEDFDRRLMRSKEKLEIFTGIYSDIEKTVHSSNCVVYFKQNDIVFKSDKLNLLTIIGISFAAAILLPILINLVWGLGSYINSYNAGKTKEEEGEKGS